MRIMREMKGFKCIEDFTISDCCSFLKIEYSKLPGVLNNIQATEDNSKVIAHIRKSIEVDKNKFASCSTIKQYKAYLSASPDGLYRKQAAEKIDLLKAEEEEKSYYDVNKVNIAGCEAHLNGETAAMPWKQRNNEERATSEKVQSAPTPTYKPKRSQATQQMVTPPPKATSKPKVVQSNKVQPEEPIRKGKSKVIPYLVAAIISVVVCVWGIDAYDTYTTNQQRKEQKEEYTQVKQELGQEVLLLNIEDGYVNGHGYVDLGLSVKWATCNVGASSPSDCGDYYAWGETETKREYNLSNYKYFDEYDEYAHTFWTKYNESDGKRILDYEDDVAYVKWGKDWRTPTKGEIKELLDRCTWTWICLNGKGGVQATGPNGKSIFLPAGGSRVDDEVRNFGEAGWIRSCSFDDDGRNPCYLFFQDDIPRVSARVNTRFLGLTIRPVLQ